MFKPNRVTLFGSTSRPHVWVCLVVLLSLALPATVLAGPPEPSYQGPEKCAECHSAETEAWKNSPHARAMADLDRALFTACGEAGAGEECNCLACHTTDFDPASGTYAYEGVSCEACHGPYVEGHPKNGVMNLDVDSSVCRDCHAETHQQWQDSLHAQAGVQCIGCHLSHSQDFRLTDEALCGACHRDQIKDFAHTAHETADVDCTDCHLSAMPASEMTALASLDQSIAHVEAPSHSFTVASSGACVECHGETVHEVAPRSDLSPVAFAEPPSSDERTRELAAKAAEQEKTIESLQVMSLVSLGLGLGIGGMLGVVVMLILGYVTQRRAGQ
jgi:hypothetical protein